MKDLLDLLNSGDYTTLILLSLIFIFIWLFKDMKKSLLETKKSDLNFIDQSIESQAQSLKSIYLYLNNSISECDLLDSLYSSYKYFDKHILDIIYNFTSSYYTIPSQERSTLLVGLSKELKSKINILKDKQLYETVNKQFKFSILDFEDSAKRNNFDIYYNAFLFTLIILSISLCALEVILKIYTLDSQTSILLIVFIYAFIMWLILLPNSFDFLFKKCYKKLFLFILFFLSPFTSLYLMNICKYYFGKIFILIIFILFVFISYYINIKFSKSLQKK